MRLLSLDIWDTVLRRRCHHNESKYGLGKYVYLKYYKFLKSEYKPYSIEELVLIRCGIEDKAAKDNIRDGYDYEYNIHNVIYKWINTIFIDYENYNDSIVDELVKFELGYERFITYLDKDICKKINKIDYDKLIYISDFYMGKVYLNNILEEYDNQINFDDGYVSCDLKHNKSSGNLFNIVRKSEANLTKYIHIGDNYNSDYKSPRKQGIDSRIYRPFRNEIYRNINKINFFFRSKFKGKIKNYLNGYIHKANKELKNIRTDDKYINLGLDYGMFFVLFIHGVIEAAIKEGVDKVYYFTREGEFFKKIHDQIAKEDTFGFPIPKAKLLEVSRMATYAPSIQEISIEGMMRLWSQYPTQSLEAYFKSINILIDEYKLYLNRYNLYDIKTPIECIYKDSRIINLFNDITFVNKLKGEIDKKKDLFLKYMSQKGIHHDLSKIFVVDIGWRGSIQDNIALVYPNSQIIGYYMALYRPYYKKLSNSKKLGFVNSDEKENYLWYFRQPYPLEMYTNSRSGSVVGYELLDNNWVSPVKDNYKEEDIVYDKFVKKFQEGVCNTISIYGNLIRTYSFISDDLKYYALNRLKKMMIKPNKDTRRPFFEMVDNNNFGIGKLEDMSEVLNTKSVFKSLCSTNIKNNIDILIEKSNWGHGLFRYYHLYVLNYVYCITSKIIYNGYSSHSPLKVGSKLKISLKGYKKYDKEIKYSKEHFESSGAFVYVQGSIAIPKEFGNNYDILIQRDYKDSKSYYTTELFLDTNKNLISFEGKVPIINNNCNMKILLINKEKLLYGLIDIEKSNKISER